MVINLTVSITFEAEGPLNRDALTVEFDKVRLQSDGKDVESEYVGHQTENVDVDSDEEELDGNT